MKTRYLESRRTLLAAATVSFDLSGAAHANDDAWTSALSVVGGALALQTRPCVGELLEPFN
jgi:hypothetical protein